jgi:hypothetical protein
MDDMYGMMKSSSNEKHALTSCTRKGKRGSPGRRGSLGRIDSPKRETSP